MRARHRLSKLLLRRDVRFDGRAWSERHRGWLAGIELEQEAAQAALIDYRGAVEVPLHRRAELERTITRAFAYAEAPGQGPCLRGPSPACTGRNASQSIT